LQTIATLLYAANLVVGLAARLGGVRWGVFHHILYAVVFASSIGAAITAFHPGLVVTLAALAAFPWAHPGTILHPALAAAGAMGYAIAWCWP